MIGTGSIILTHNTGWSCAKECTVDVEVDVKPDKTATRTMVVSISKLFDCQGSADGLVKGIVKFDTGNKIAFEGILMKKMRLEVKGKAHDDFKPILDQINKLLTIKQK
jgi:hypothetical protein